MSDKNNETTHNLTKEEIDQAFFIPKVNIPFDGKVQLQGRIKRSDKKQLRTFEEEYDFMKRNLRQVRPVERFDLEYDTPNYCDKGEVNYCEDGELYDVEDVHEAIKKSIDNESIEMIKADLVAYFGLELEK